MLLLYVQYPSSNDRIFVSEVAGCMWLSFHICSSVYFPCVINKTLAIPDSPLLPFLLCLAIWSFLVYTLYLSLIDCFLLWWTGSQNSCHWIVIHSIENQSKTKSNQTQNQTTPPQQSLMRTVFQRNHTNQTTVVKCQNSLSTDSLADIYFKPFSLLFPPAFFFKALATT